jgi:hypothetical protein
MMNKLTAITARYGIAGLLLMTVALNRYSKITHETAGSIAPANKPVRILFLFSINRRLNMKLPVV